VLRPAGGFDDPRPAALLGCPKCTQRQRGGRGPALNLSDQRARQLPRRRPRVAYNFVTRLCHEINHNGRGSMGRKPIGKRAMTAAQRQRRARKKKATEQAAARSVEMAERKMADLQFHATGPPRSDWWEVIVGDCLDVLPTLPDRSAPSVVTDPPYNVGVNYGNGADKDRLPDDVYVAWCRSWFDQIHRILTDDGTFWLLCGYEYAAELAVELKRAGFHRRAWVTWYETFGVCNSAMTNLSRTSRPLFYCVKDVKRFAWHPEAVNVLSARQKKYADARANPEGKVMDDVWGVDGLWDDVWKVSRVNGTFEERIPGFPTQLPLDLLETIVGATSDPGDLVLDPFSGSATTGEAALRLGRRYLGIEKSERFAELSRLRLRGVAT